MIDRVEEVGKNQYLINGDVRIEVDDNLNITAYFDEHKYTEDDVNLLIDALFQRVAAISEFVAGEHQLH